MRYFILLFLLVFTLIGKSQVTGDITGDEIIDANDYLQLRNDINKGKGFNLLADFDDDGHQSVRDLVLLYDFLYENAKDLHRVNIVENKELVNISFGTYHFQKRSLEVRISADKLKAFQFEISNIEILAIQKNDKNIYLIGNKIVGLPPKKGYFDEDIILNLKLNNGIDNEYCIKNYLFLDALGNNYRTEVGDCAMPSWSEEGLGKVKQDVVKNGFDILTDIDRNGKVDVKDYTILFDYLKSNGPAPPGIISDTKSKLKVEFGDSYPTESEFDILVSGNDNVSSFDISFYGIQKITSVSSDQINAFEIVDNRIIWFGGADMKTKEISLKVGYEKSESSKKVCMRSPVFLGNNSQYFDVKLGRCLDLSSSSEESNLFAQKKVSKEKNKKVKKEKGSKEKSGKEKSAKKEKNNSSGNDENSSSSDELVEEESKSDDATSKLKEINNISNREKKKNAEANDPENKLTVKILSLNKLQIKTTIGTKGQMIFNNEDKVFMIFNGITWEVLKAIPDISIKE